MDSECVTIDPRVRWGTPCVRDTGISVAHLVALHDAGRSIGQIAEACPPLADDDVARALDWAARRGPEALGPRPPTPGRRHPNIVVDRSVQGGLPTIRGTRVTVDAVLGMWEEGFAVGEILDEYPGLTADDVHDALAYDAVVVRSTRLVIDENLSPRLAESLRREGHDAVHVNEVGLRSTPDPVIMTWAARERRTVVTADQDFFDHLGELGATRPSVVKVVQRGPEGLAGHAAQAQRLARALPGLDHRLAHGAAVTLDRTATADRRLPLVHERGWAR